MLGFLLTDCETREKPGVKSCPLPRIFRNRSAAAARGRKDRVHGSGGGYPSTKMISSALSSIAGLPVCLNSFALTRTDFCLFVSFAHCHYVAVVVFPSSIYFRLPTKHDDFLVQTIVGDTLTITYRHRIRQQSPQAPWSSAPLNPSLPAHVSERVYTSMGSSRPLRREQPACSVLRPPFSPTRRLAPPGAPVLQLSPRPCGPALERIWFRFWRPKWSGFCLPQGRPPAE